MKVEIFDNGNHYCVDEPDTQIVFSSTNYDSDIDMWLDMVRVMRSLLRTQQIVTLRQEDSDIFILEHGHDENVDCWGCPQLRWLSPEEAQKLELDRENYLEKYLQNEEEEEI